jgi:hypothetical protein
MQESVHRRFSHVYADPLECCAMVSSARVITGSWESFIEQV